MLIFQLISEFFITGLFAVGGGLATIPFLSAMTTKYDWFTTETLTTMIAISESTPGAMGVNMATYVGVHMMGLVGGVVTTLSLVAPSIIVICIVAQFLNQFKESKIVQSIFYGLRPAVVALIVVACSSIFMQVFLIGRTFENMQLNILNATVFLFVFVLYKWKKLNPILIIVMTACLGILLQL